MAGSVDARRPGRWSGDDDALFRSLHDAYPDALLVVDPAGAIVLANQAAATLFGYTEAELTTLRVDALVPDAVRARHGAYRAAYAGNPKARPMGTQMNLAARRRDGSEVMVEIALSPLPGVGGPLVVAAIRDIGGYPRVKEALRRARYSEFLAQLGRLAVDTRDPHVLLGQVPAIAADALNAGVAKVFLLEPNRLDFRIAAGVGLRDGDRVGSLVANRPDTPPGFILSEGRAVRIPDLRLERRFSVPPSHLEGDRFQAAGTTVSDRGRTIGVLMVGLPLEPAMGEDEIRFLESLSSLLATSLQRVHNEEALNHAQRLESVGQLTGGIAHDFNNLLTVIQGNLQVLEELPQIASDGHALQLVGSATRAARRGAELTGKLLAFSRRQVLLPTAVDVAAMLESLADMLRRTLDQRIRIDVRTAPDVSCLADPGQLESALLNIAINARDAMPDGGTLSFRAERCESVPGTVLGELGKDDPSAGELIEISIADSGSGMSEDVKERAFEPFFTTKKVGRGTGLGLSSVHGFVKQSKGAISIATKLGVGTSVSLYLPTAESSAGARTADKGASGDVPPGLRVLLVEDDAEVRGVVHAFLDALDCRTAACSSGEQAMQVMAMGAGFDLLLTDIALGAGMRGTELAAWMKEHHPELGVLLMSGFSSELLEADRDSPPDWELLQKPYSREELARAIGRAIG